MTRSAGIDRGRRALLSLALLAPLAACAKPAAPVLAPTQPVPTPEAAARFAELERRFDARLGVFAVATGSGAMLAYRADERFAFCSTFKALAAAAVLARNPISHLETRVWFTDADITTFAPVTKERVGTGMTLGELCAAAVSYSDSTAGNLLLDDVGGTAGFNEFLRGLGDQVGRLDHYEPELNTMAPGDDADTTSPRAIATDYRALVLGTALAEDKRALLADLLVRSVTGAKRIKAGVPAGWTVAGKTGTGSYGRANDVAIVTPPSGAPLVLAIMSDRAGGYDAQPSEELIAEAAKYLVATLH
ncbi:class A beta-lactamase [Nocardia sp. NPDC052566]|uniref:class A beta-lactamase n=1 Tax=Nocardia sp. NPDC052566 TaxID=3364330 RepID=UPI0037C527C4